MQSLRSLLGRRVISAQTQKVLGVLQKGVADPDTGKVIAFSLKTGGDRNWLPLIDIQRFEAEEVIVASEGRLVVVDDLPRVKKLLESPLKLLDARVFTESGRFLGKVVDVVFDEHSGEILKYYVARPFLLSPLKAYLVVDRREVLRVEKRGVIVKDPEKKVPAQALA